MRLPELMNRSTATRMRYETFLKIQGNETEILNDGTS